jgi:transposase
MPYRIAGIDVHKKMLAVVVTDVEVDGDFHFERQKVGTTPADLRRLADWLVEQKVEEVVMESTAQYWRPVWEALEQHWRPRRRQREGARPRWQARCTWRRRSRIEERAGARRIYRERSGRRRLSASVRSGSLAALASRRSSGTMD